MHFPSTYFVRFFIYCTLDIVLENYENNLLKKTVRMLSMFAVIYYFLIVDRVLQANFTHWPLEQTREDGKRWRIGCTQLSIPSKLKIEYEECLGSCADFSFLYCSLLELQWWDLNSKCRECELHLSVFISECFVLETLVCTWHVYSECFYFWMFSLSVLWSLE